MTEPELDDARGAAEQLAQERFASSDTDEFVRAIKCTFDRIEALLDEAHVLTCQSEPGWAYSLIAALVGCDQPSPCVWKGAPRSVLESSAAVMSLVADFASQVDGRHGLPDDRVFQLRWIAVHLATRAIARSRGDLAVAEYALKQSPADGLTASELLCRDDVAASRKRLNELIDLRSAVDQALARSEDDEHELLTGDGIRERYADLLDRSRPA